MLGWSIDLWMTRDKFGHANQLPMKSALSRRLLPHLSTLVAFEAAARLRSITRAATELSLTQGAISRRIKLLEDQLGARMFERVRQRIELTEAGSYYAAQVRQILENLASATAQTMTYRAEGGTLNISVVPTFGTRWLVPRLPEFFKLHPKITISVTTHIDAVDFRRTDVDVVIHHGGAHLVGAVLHKLMGEEQVVVASPEYIEAEKIHTPADLTRVTLLAQSTRPTAWSSWFALHDVLPSAPPVTLVFEQISMMLRAASAKLGVALVPRILVQPELAAGDLVELFEPVHLEKSGYYLAYSRERANHPTVVAFRDWLLGQVA
jgi:LysR family glycine cleavage system transcriptional activator